MGNKPSGRMVGLILAKIVCCVGLLLFLTGVLTLNGIGIWLFGGNTIWLVITVILAMVVGMVLFRRRKSRGQIQAEGSR